MANVELDGLLLPAALAAASWLAPYSFVGLLGHLLPDGDHARALLCISADVLCRVCSCRHRATAAGTEPPESITFCKSWSVPYTVRTLRLSAASCATAHACTRRSTRSRPTDPYSPHMDLCGRCAYGPQNARHRRLRVTGRHAWSTRGRQWSLSCRRRCCGLALWVLRHLSTLIIIWCE